MKSSRAIFVNARFFLGFAGVIVCMVVGFFFPPMVEIAWILLVLLCVLALTDLVVLLSSRQGVKARRILPQRFSNGDQNKIKIELQNNYPFQVTCRIIDEIPVIFQVRDFALNTVMLPHTVKSIVYELRPLKRGVYAFGALRVFARSMIGLISLRYTFPAEEDIHVFPSFIRLQEYDLQARQNLRLPGGIKRVRKLGHTMEFENIREYVQGDDWRGINWKATSRNNKLMTNQYTDEKSQQVYCLIDTGRSMRMPFNGLTLLDYAVNASLALSYVVLQRQDRAGLVVSGHRRLNAVQADNRRSQFHRIMEQLYAIKTDFPESDFGYLQSGLRRLAPHRSLIILFTNFETKDALFRQLPALQSIAKNHLLLVIGFKNTELEKLTSGKADIIRDIYDKAVAENFMLEKKLIQHELRQRGILSLLVTPDELNIKLINKYLEIKSKNSI